MARTAKELKIQKQIKWNVTKKDTKWYKSEKERVKSKGRELSEVQTKDDKHEKTN